jgi:general stress protein 26
MNDVQHFAKIIKEIKFAMLTTFGEDEHLRSRPMTLQDVEFDGDLWFFADHTSHLAKDIELNPKVNLSFADVKDNSYISASGQA